MDETYEKDRIIKDEYKKRIIRNDYPVDPNQAEIGARLRLDRETYEPKVVNEFTTAGGYGGTLESPEQEKQRLFRLLISNITENEIRMRVLRDILCGLEIRNKQLYVLRDQVNKSNENQMAQIQQLREILK